MTHLHRRWHLVLWFVVGTVVGLVATLTLLLRGEVTP